MPDVTPSGDDRRGTRPQERAEWAERAERAEPTSVVSGGQEAPATTAERRSAFTEMTRDARGARAAGEGGELRGPSTADAGAQDANASRGTESAQATRTGSPLLPHEECDKLTARIQHAVAEFVERPRDAVEEADHVLEELTTRFTDAVNSRRRTLRGSWQLTDDREDAATTADTEQLRLALRDYRELTERLLHM
ncbi:hypothetical protein [Streptomyces sp. NPDC006527]|uniref:hypothetical protein n=1 Tax=Streptomyces sp. NPDC006527 TaxID=3364749 RepID=UPI003676723F